MIGPNCGEYVINVGPGPGRSGSGCGGGSCVFSCENTTANDLAWIWGRVVSNTSDASLAINKESRCCECVPRKWHDELSFWRKREDGSLALKWVGPVVDVVDDSAQGSLTIRAKDRSVWLLEAWRIVNGFSGITEPAEARFERLVKLATLGPLGLKLIRVGDADLSGVNISDAVRSWSTLGPELQKLASFGVQWTVLADRLYFGRLSGRLTDALIDPSVAWEGGGALVSDLGDTTITNLVIEGDDPVTGPYRTVWPPFPSPDPCEGIHIKTLEPAFELSRSDSERFAREEFERLSAQGLSVATSVDSSISDQWPIDLCDMRPGGTVVVDTSSDAFCMTAQTEATLKEMRVEGAGCLGVAAKVDLAPAVAVDVDLT